jgi:hypothetical protein
LAGCGVTSGRRFGLAHFSNSLYFFDDFSKLTCDLGLFLFESSSGIKAHSFAVFWDLGQKLSNNEYVFQEVAARFSNKM